MDDIRAEIIRDEIKSGLAQVDDTLTLDEFSCYFDPNGRKITVHFTAKTETGESVAINIDY